MNRFRPVHRVGQRGLGDRPHSKVAQPRLAGNLRVQAGEELPPAVVVGAVRLDGVFKSMLGQELEKLGKDGIVMHSSRFDC